MQLISVIVPIYKVEKFLNNCIESIVNQSYRTLQIILVDDGSPDSCPEICDAWARKDSRITVVHKENGGLSDARNAGLAVAKGDYISFVDSDDWLMPNFYEILTSSLQQAGAQIAASGIVWAYDDHFQEDPNEYKKKLYTAQEAMATLIQGKCFYAVAWNKLYKANLFERIRFPTGKLHEDEYVTYQVIGRAEKLVLCSEAKYFYRQRSGSIMQEWSLRHLDALDAFFARNNYLKEKFPELYLKDKATLFFACIGYYRECSKLPDGTEGKKKILSYTRKIYFGPQELLKLDFKTAIKLIKGRIYFATQKIHFKES